MRELDGHTFLVTGANAGIGRATAVELARRGGRVFAACRSEERARAVLEELGASGVFLSLDLGDLASVRACAKSFLERDEPLHVLINNAGIGGQRGLTADGFELNFGVNHLGHFLLTRLLLDRVTASAPARVVNVSSVGHYQAKGIDWDALRQPTKAFTAMPEYAVSKLCNVLFTQELARRLEGIGVTTYAVHPGAIASEIWKRVPWPVRPVMKAFMKSPEEGATTTLWCATAPELAGETGRYYDGCREKDPNSVATPELGRELWERSEGWTS